MTDSQSKSIRAIFIAISIVLLLCGVSVAQDKAAPEKSADKPLPEKVASVNGVAISGEDLNREYNIFLQRTGRPQENMPAAQQDQIKSDILDGLIEQELLYQQSRTLGIQIGNDTVDQQLDAIKQRYATEAEFQETLTSMQLSEVEVKKQIERGLAIREVIEQKVAAGIVIAESDSKAFYDGNPQFFMQPERVKASHILIKVDKNATDADKAAARKKIEDLRKQLQGGAAFADLAKTHSEGPSNVRGGDLGFFQRGQMVKPFEDAAFALDKDQLSGIVETDYGYHLILVTEKVPEKKLSFDEVKERLTAKLKQDRVEEQARIYIDTLKKDAKVEKFL